MQPLLRPPPAATPTGHPTDPTQPIAHDRPLDPGSAVRQSVPPAGHSALFCPSGVVLLSVVFVDLPWEATPPHFYSVTGTRPSSRRGSPVISVVTSMAALTEDSFGSSPASTMVPESP